MFRAPEPAPQFPLTDGERKAKEIRPVVLPHRSSEPAQGGLVSADQLRNRMSKEQTRKLQSARRELEEGRIANGIRILQQVKDDIAARPYALAMLGTEYLRQSRWPMAIEALAEAVRLLPGSPALHSNLGYALWQTGDLKRAADEVRRALALNLDAGSTRLLLGLILIESPSSRIEGRDQLLQVREEFSAARIGLATLYALEGQTEQMREELRAVTPDATNQMQLEQWILQLVGQASSPVAQLVP